ncbi:MAG: hydrogenase expression/formation protein HypE [Desulfobacterales bacterium]
MKNKRVLLDHGSGGALSRDLVAGIMLPAFDNTVLSRLDDSAVLDFAEGRLAFSTDSYVVDPLFFPGGNIGDLAVNGTVNDIAMSGAKPLYLSAGLIIEEGLLIQDLEAIIGSMADAARLAGVQMVTGDTKVVPRGSADKLFINTSGIGIIPEGINISGANVSPGDRILLSGTMADHGITILNQREGLSFNADIRSDTACLNRMVEEILSACPGVRVLRDPTRGGVATALNEIALQSDTGIRIREKDLPVRPDVSGLCELLGLDPLYVANEGKLIAAVDPEHAETVLSAMKKNPLGSEACIIGEAVSDNPGVLVMETTIGGERIVDMLTGEQLPRIC